MIRRGALVASRCMSMCQHGPKSAGRAATASKIVAYDMATARYMATKETVPKEIKDLNAVAQSMQASETGHIAKEQLKQLQQLCEETLQKHVLAQIDTKSDQNVINSMDSIATTIVTCTQKLCASREDQQYAQSSLKRTRKHLLQHLVDALLVERPKNGLKLVDRLLNRSEPLGKSMFSLFESLICPTCQLLEQDSRDLVISPEELSAQFPEPLFVTSPQENIVKLHDKQLHRGVMMLMYFHEVILMRSSELIVKSEAGRARDAGYHNIGDLWDDKLLAWVILSLCTRKMFALSFLLLQHCIHNLPVMLLGNCHRYFGAPCDPSLGRYLLETSVDTQERSLLLKKQEDSLRDQIRTYLRTRESEAPLFGRVSRQHRELWDQQKYAQFCDATVAFPKALSALFIGQMSHKDKQPLAWQLYCNSSPAGVMRGHKWYASKIHSTKETAHDITPESTRHIITDGGFQHHGLVASIAIAYILRHRSLSEAMWIYRHQKGNILPLAQEALIDAASTKGQLDDVFRLLGDYIRSGSQLPKDMVKRIIVGSKETFDEFHNKQVAEPIEQSAMQLLSKNEGETFPWMSASNLKDTEDWIESTSIEEVLNSTIQASTDHDQVSSHEFSGARYNKSTAQSRSPERVFGAHNLEAIRHMVSNLDRVALANFPINDRDSAHCVVEFGIQVGQLTGEWSLCFQVLRNLTLNGTDRETLESVYSLATESMTDEKESELYHIKLCCKEQALLLDTSSHRQHDDK